MDERLKRDLILFIGILIALFLFFGALETFTGVLSDMREQNLANQQNIQSISIIAMNSQKSDNNILNQKT